MAWPYPGIFYTNQGTGDGAGGGTGGTIAGPPVVGDLLLYLCNHNVSVVTPVDNLGASWTALALNVTFGGAAFREDHDLWAKVAVGGETTLSTSGSIDKDVFITVRGALPGLPGFGSYLDQAARVVPNPGRWVDPFPLPSVAFVSQPTIELVWLTTLNFGNGSGTTTTYTGPNGRIYFDEGNSLNNGIIVWANRVGGTASPAQDWDVGLTNRFFEGAIVIYLHVPFDGPKWNVF